VRRLTPEPTGELDPTLLASAYTDPRRTRIGGRPWVMVNMIASADGATALDGRSGGLGGPGDRAVFAVLRSLADVILVGASTVRAEGYRPPKKPGQRVAVVSRTGDLDWESELFAGGAGLAVLPEDGPIVPVPAIRAGRGGVDLARALPLLAGNVVLAEGGPTLNGDLAGAGLIDELCLTVAPVLVGGQAKRILSGPPVTAPPLDLVQVLEEDGYVFFRYLRADHGTARR
jgi:riboflavin biosynthesis pyrimidine reductase